MSHRPPHRLAAAGLVAVLGVALAACAPLASADDDAPDASATVIVENARPTLMTEDGDDGPETYEDTSVARQDVEAPYQPERVVTFDLGSLDTLHALGAGDTVVGIPDAALPDYLAEYAELPKVGSLFEPDFEAVAELEPELIITAARSTGAYDELSEISTVIDLTAAFAGAFDPAASLDRATQLAQVFGKEGELAELAARIEKNESRIAELAPDAGPALLVSVSGGEYGAFAEGSRFGYFFDVLGFQPAVAAAELPGQEGSPHGDVVSNEFILAAQPDVILVLDRSAAIGETGGASAAETLDNELVARTPAAQNDRFIHLPAAELYLVISGITAIDNVLDAVLDDLEA